MIRTLLAASAVVLASTGAFALDEESAARLKFKFNGNVAPGQIANDLKAGRERGELASWLAQLNGNNNCKDDPKVCAALPLRQVD